MQFYGRVQGFPCTHLRLYSIYGPWEERDRLVPRLISLGLQGLYPPLVNPEITRDFVYVDDCTRAFVRAATTTCRSRPGQVFNIATGVKTSLADIAGRVRTILSIPGEPVFGSMPNRRWDLSDWFGDPLLAREKLGWTHRHSLEEGLIVDCGMGTARERREFGSVSCRRRWSAYRRSSRATVTMRRSPSCINA